MPRFATSRRTALLLALAASAVAAFAARQAPPSALVLEIGGFDRALAEGEWTRSTRGRFREEEVPDGVNPFYYRHAPPTGALALPLVAEGPLRLRWRASSNVRTLIDVVVDGRSVAEIAVNRGAFKLHEMSFTPPAADARGTRLPFTLQAAPLVRSYEAADPKVMVDRIELEAERFRLSNAAVAAVFLAPLMVFAFASLTGSSPGLALLAAAVTGAATVGLAATAPLALAVALPRLGPVALLAGVLARAMLAGRGDVVDRGRIALLVAAGVALHGSVAFFPDHAPPDLDIHVRRTLDFATVPFEYDALMRYSSQLPTASQDIGQATDALGAGVLIPYSPLPYVAWYAAHRAGLDLYWAMPAINAAAVLLLAPLLYLAAAWAFSREAGLLAAALLALDLSSWHHFGRHHAPAVFGMALGSAALLYLMRRAEDLGDRRVATGAALALGVAVTGYSSLAVMYALFGVALLVLLAVDARGLDRAQKTGAMAALVLGGALGLGLFYGHYVPGLIGGARGVEAEPDLFPGRTFFIFNNESRQVMRQWALGLWAPFLLAAVALPFALKRARASTRPFLAAWALAWALVMALKEPFLFPRLLRWGKEDLFVAPALALLIAGGLAAVPARVPRRLLQAAVLAGLLWLQWRDFLHHANSLRL